ncbi:MAG: hypothetical protein JWL98_110, partial [Xanthomonadaceae bacterium]|nr:hypothetical protein [Xanthomonadaceae bacterium]
WRYMQWKNLTALPTMRLRARWFVRRLFPNMAYLRQLYGRDAGAASLLVERSRRLFHRLRGA